MTDELPWYKLGAIASFELQYSILMVLSLILEVSGSIFTRSSEPRISEEERRRCISTAT